MADDYGKQGLILSESLSDEEFDMLLALLRHTRKTQIFDVISHIIHSKEDFLLFLDALASDVIRVPSRKETLKVIDAVAIYNFYRKQPYETHDARIKITAKRYKMNIKSVNRIVDVVSNVLASDVIFSENHQILTPSHQEQGLDFDS